MVSERVKKLREKAFVLPEICTDRAYWYTASYKETEGEALVLRRAKAIAKVLENMTLLIDDDELLVGRVTSKKRGGMLNPESNAQWIINELDTIHNRDWDKYAPIKESEKDIIKDVAAYWKGKSLNDHWEAQIPAEAMQKYHLIHDAIFCSAGFIMGHSIPNYEKVLRMGIKGLKQETEECLSKMTVATAEDLKKQYNYKAWQIVLEGIICYAKRYAELARKMAAQEENPTRKEELIQISQTCDWVPENPPRNFREAMQATWFTYVAYMIENNAPGIGFGRMDQYLYPFYKSDRDSGILTREDARELLGVFFIKINGTTVPISDIATRCFGGHPLTCDITLGGVDKEGQDAVNELSYVFLDAQEDTALTSEEIVIRYNRKTSHAFMMKAMEVAIKLQGKFKWVGDKTIIQQLLAEQRPIEMARDYCIDGCFQPTIGGRSHDIPGGPFNMPLALELAINNGVSRITGLKLGLETGDPREFSSYEDVWNAFESQVKYLMPFSIMYKTLDIRLRKEMCPNPVVSVLLEGCMERGLDVLDGGVGTNSTQCTLLAGIPDVADSLAALKKVVFEDKKITMAQVVNAIEKDFAGYEDIQSILSKAPKFGNDDDYVDKIAENIITLGSHEIYKYDRIDGIKSTAAAAVITSNVPYGEVVGALPDGRNAGMPISEGGISPHQGRNISGLTSTLNSVAKLDHHKLTGGSVLNIRVNPELLENKDNREKLVFLLETFFETGGFLIQMNVVDTKTLRAAQAEPEKYKDLLVRVATYSAYFVELSPDLQNDIIARMEIERI